MLLLQHAGVPDGGMWYLIQAVHGNMSIIITVEALYMGAIVCHMADFLTLKTPVIIAGHGLDR